MTPVIVGKAEPEAADPPAVVPVHPRIEFPHDSGLRDLPKLFSSEWVSSAYRSLAREDDPDPDRFRIRQVSYVPGRVAIVSYFAEWPPEAYLPWQHFNVRAERGRPVEVFQFPNDRSLPGLPQAVDPGAALSLVKEHVLAFGARRMRVEVVRYRPGSRAVLRHRVGRLGLYARVIRPASLSPFLGGWELIARSSFVAPRVVGHWADGGVVWLSEIPGKNLRRLIRRGTQPDSAALLDGLATLWTQREVGPQRQPFNLSSAYGRAKRSFRHFARDNDGTSALIKRIIQTMDPFVESWRPSSIAHNDFYDDQILVLDDGRLALVDLEEAGPGDPMLDVGNFLAHLRWSARFGSQREGSGATSYLDEVRGASLERFAWNERDLNLREAVCLFRISTNAIRHPREDWRDRLHAGLSLVAEVLE